MDEDDSSDFKDPYQCRMMLTVPKGKRKLLMKIISPLTGWIDPSFKLINIQENSKYSGQRSVEKEAIEKDPTPEYIRIPSISVMSFLSEKGEECAKDVQSCFQKRPWKFHHKVELYSRRSPDHAAACQDFYGIADDMPLWSVCPVHCGNEHFRFLIYVRNFQKMVEFYRVITDVEMESNKPGFCIFQLYTQQGLDIQLALKYSKYIEPYPVNNARLVLKVKSFDVIRSSLGCDMKEMEDGSCSIQDPDGNVLSITEHPRQHLHELSSHLSSHVCLSEDLKSYRSSSDSHDSGRCSDSENWSSEPENMKVDSVSKTNCDVNVKFPHKLSHVEKETPHISSYKGTKIEQGHQAKLARQADINISESSHSSKWKIEPVYL